MVYFQFILMVPRKDLNNARVADDFSTFLSVKKLD
jgi:hypothetical protein